jgi:tRNA 5-methylaminomethyl-2-thiouridine biosynthesis bifunctional protein
MLRRHAPRRHAPRLGEPRLREPVAAPLRPARLVFRDGVPWSPDYGDVYHSGDGIAEREQVFVDGNALRQRFARLPPRTVFHVGELGFGTGLASLLAARAFMEVAPADALLHVTSFEAHPLHSDDLARLQALRHPLAGWHARLRAVYPPPLPGWHRRWLAPRVSLSLWFGDAAAGLDALAAAGARAVDAWFLDGFAPARNPAMFAARTLAAVGALSHRGTTAASYTVAAGVRHALAQAGFRVERVDGTPLKRHHLRATFAGSRAGARHAPERVTVIGGGLAGACVAQALRRRGTQVRVLDGRGAGAPLLPAAALHLRASVHPLGTALRAAALGCSASLLHGQPGWHACGRLDVDVPAAACPWPSLPVDAHAARALSGMPAARGGAWWPGGGFADVPVLAEHMLASAERVHAHVTGVEATGAGWRLATTAGAMRAEHVVVAAPGAAAGLAGIGPHLRHVAGTLTVFRTRTSPCSVVGGNGCLAPLGHGLVASAGTYERGEPWAADRADAANAARLHACALAPLAVAARFHGSRCGTRDRLPLVGGLDDGLWLATGFGSDALALAPLAAEMLAGMLAAEPPAVDAGIAAALSPRRFAVTPARTGAR